MYDVCVFVRSMRDSRLSWKGKDARSPDQLHQALPHPDWRWCVGVLFLCVGCDSYVGYVVLLSYVCVGGVFSQSQVTGTLTRARSDYERIHDQLMLEVPQLVEVKGSYLDLCLLAVIRAQVRSVTKNLVPD